jgi:tRNA (guanine37-N1)-methyltransferase
VRIDILTLLPELFGPFMSSSVLGRAAAGVLEIRVTNIRDFAADRHGTVDDAPYGGGPGMVMKPGPVFRAVESVWSPEQQGSALVLLSPQGEPFSQETAREFAALEHLVLICGRYEGFDERIRQGLRPREVSIGDYVLMGGEVPAMAVVEAVARLVPGVLGDPDSRHEESFSDHLLEYPQYTRPAEFRGMRVPEVLLSGDHGAIRRWRAECAAQRTRKRRQDLWKPGRTTIETQESTDDVED